MRGWVVVYRLPKGSSDVDRVKFRQRLIGATTTSWGGKYEHHRTGLLERIPNRRVMPGVVLVGNEHLDELRALLHEWRALALLREVKLEPDDLPYLKPRPLPP